MKNKFKYLLALPLVASVTLTSCDKDDPEIPNEEELITTVIYTLTPEGGGNAVEFRFTDLDGDGGDAPIISNGTLAANTTYSSVITLLNETETPAKDITEEVEEEAEEHQLFYEFSNMSFSGGFDYADADGNGNPIGILTTFATGTPLTSDLTITLRHEPDKGAVGVAAGDITNAGGETDIEVTFEVTVQ
jgi:hypothetical protein